MTGSRLPAVMRKRALVSSKNLRKFLIFVEIQKQKKIITIFMRVCQRILDDCFLPNASRNHRLVPVGGFN